MNDVIFDVTLNDNRVAHCRQAFSQEYENCIWSAGLVKGIDPDTLYLRLEDKPSTKKSFMTLFLTPGEMLAILWVCSGAMWAAEMEATGLERVEFVKEKWDEPEVV